MFSTTCLVNDIMRVVCNTLYVTLRYGTTTDMYVGGGGGGGGKYVLSGSHSICVSEHYK